MLRPNLAAEPRLQGESRRWSVTTAIVRVGALAARNGERALHAAGLVAGY